MATFDIPFSFFFIIFLFPQIAATGCGGSSCYRNGPLIRFPFRLSHQPSNCWYSIHFDLSCDTNRRTILTLPAAGDFEVQSINYADQTVWINDLNWCMHKPFLDKDFSLVDTPFNFWHRRENYTYFRCPSEVVSIGPFASISCLGGSDYNVIAVPSSWSTTTKPPPQSRCRAISTALLPSGSFEWGYFYAVKLTWNVPDCRSCEETGKFCGINVTSATSSYCDATGQFCGINVTSWEIVCSSSSTHGVSRATKKRIVWGVLISVAGLVCIVGHALRVSGTRRRDGAQTQETNSRVRLQGLIAELSNVVTTGLDSQTIESYKKTQLGENLDLPDPNDKTCSICLGEYQPEETLRTIPECNHYFHAGCIDEWLRKNPTCPLCRNLPPTPDVSLVRPHEEHSIC